MRFAALVSSLSSGALLLGFPSLAAAQSPSIDLRGWHGSPDAEAGMTLEPVSAPDTGEWNVGLRVSWAYRPFELESGSVVVVPIEHQVTSDFVAGIGIGRRLLLGMDLPYVLAQTGDDVTDPGIRAALGTDAAPVVALGDLGLSAKIIIMPAEEPEFGGFGVAALQRVSLPTGDEGGWIGEGAATSESRLLVEWRSAPLSLLLAGGLKFRFEDETFLCRGASPSADPDCATQFGNELPTAFGVVLRPSGLGAESELGEAMSLHGELRSYLPLTPVGPFERGESAGAFSSLGARLRARDVSFFGGVEIALTDGVGNAPVRVSLGLDFAPRDHDQDDDRIEDETDQCRELPEDFDGHEDDDGCPEVDDDQDQVPDGQDQCPRAPEDRDGYQDEDGCPDPDNDGDGAPDSMDRCPMVPAPGTADGCPAADADGDGVVGPADRCPEQPEDRDGQQDDDGCPDADDDADGTPDVEDACPREPGPGSSDPKRRGCPNADPDGDTFEGAADKCPNEAETFDGNADDDGCPEAPPARGKPPTPLAEVVVKGDVATLTPNGVLAFGPDDEPTAPSEPMLRAIAQIAKKTPGARLLVGARPSPQRKDAAQKRAFAVAHDLRGFLGKDDAVQVVDWAQVKGAPRAEVYGVGIVLAK